jgi:type VI protein secretion system component VasK
MEQLFNDIRYYIDLRVKRFKLGMVEHTSLVFAKLLSFFTIILMAAISVMLFAGALTVLVYQWTGSLLLAFVIMGGVMALAAVVVWMLRNRFFRGAMISSFSSMLFKDEEEEDEDDEED